jgi:hypothetical protein
LTPSSMLLINVGTEKPAHQGKVIFYGNSILINIIFVGTVWL